MTVCVVAGTRVGGFGAYAYCSPLLRPLAHTPDMWVLLATVAVWFRARPVTGKQLPALLLALPAAAVVDYLAVSLPDLAEKLLT